MDVINELSAVLDISTSELISNMSTAPLEYKEFSIKKRSGGERVIAQPTPALKNIQRAICDVFLSRLKTSDSTMAYTKGVSIRNNAEKHAGKGFLLKMDFKDFFPSIKPVDFFKLLKDAELKLENVDKLLLAKYLFRLNDGHPELAIGAPSSPMLSNAVMLKFDLEIEKICAEDEVTYTRYADDLTFSSNSFDVLKKVQEYVEKYTHELEYPSLTINKDKTHIIGTGRSQRVTGVVLTHEGGVSVGRRLRKKVRAMMYLYSKKGLKQSDIPYLHGILSHINCIEPEYYNKMILQYGIDTLKALAVQSYAIGKKKRQSNI